MNYILLTVQTVIFLWSAFLVGEMILRRFTPAAFSPTWRYGVSTLLGLGLWSLVGTALALLGLFNANILRGLLLLVFVVSWPQVRRIPLEWRPTVSRLRTAFFHLSPLKAIIALWLLIAFIFIFMPITGFDAQRYHLPIIKDIIAQESFTFSEAIYNYAYLPVGGEILYAIPSAIFGNLSDPYIFQLLQFALFLILLALIYGFLRTRTRFAFLALVGVLAAMSLMDFEREVFHGGYIDVVMFTFAIGSFLVLLDHVERRGSIRSSVVLISAFLLGIALTIKYLAFSFAIFNAALLLILVWRERAQVLQALRICALYGGMVFLVAGFWYLKNFFTFGDPFYPMLSHAEFAPTLGWWIADRTLLNMFVFPIFRYGRWFFDDTESSSHVVTLAYFFSMYFFAAFFAVRRIRISFAEIVLFIAVNANFWAFFFISHQNRYLLGSVILMPVLLALWADRFYGQVLDGIALRWHATAKKVVMALVIVFFLTTLGGFVHYFQYKFWYVIGRDTKAEYIENIGGL
ncbi:hypothetical protein A3D66_02135 [Candidatus Kaiserbacteria bacterium RIFCSPHIGHO2_02_FULL_50_9]|uniref:Glycosyltransferase RgtA/B/C/D-like domain-containing protein n=1 Tax=Candidatus Kaiserbacteria bacterium RIFCSPLOWO2_01_FULL_51_21 TaxID=1798508 RepID=A0A1F6EE58_9BACT|nr:MAG: hypothetical protein A2761_02905 [Candidatus Kaiserbacteria bacterium RIFCSPHIGHO2_01_FULL_51_33]OGG63403.1 MAG: hypothetical protein A3D66_02135 [Candidatus Kaiserbacteria bacterium RIFCSPHIGHO2_02_FULL_50_9]OGG71938.1 MAG: hypothetical protein A3A35_02480 [Candidatus Kaiserbacteria bacterium RIFCSPLOWO2_01_FULL_51_21]